MVWYCYSCHKELKPRKHYCEACLEMLKGYSEAGMGAILQYEHLEGYGKVLTSRLKEMERRVIIPSKSDPTGYHCGRLGENGKIQEREPGY